MTLTSLEAFVRGRLLSADLGGSRVAVAAPSPATAQILAEAGIEVVPSPAPTDFVIDRDARLTTEMVADHPERLASLRGVVETTATGRSHLEKLLKAGRLQVPVVAADRSTCLQESSAAATSESVIQSILRVTNVRMAGKRVTVVGYGHLGRAIVHRVSAMGGRVTVVDSDPLRVLEAHLGGHAVARLLEAVASSEIIITATGTGSSLEASHFDVMATSTMVIDGSGRGESIRLPESNVARREVRSGVVELDVAGVPVYALLSPDPPVPPLSAAVAVLGLAVVGGLAPGVHAFPAELDAGLASAFLGAAT
ncbi:hypothetical protein BH23ACT5_BH23ACT5_04660 [soil metagenome]